MLYPQNGDRIVAIDSVTSLDPMYNSGSILRHFLKHVTLRNLCYTLGSEIIARTTVFFAFISADHDDIQAYRPLLSTF